MGWETARGCPLPVSNRCSILATMTTEPLQSAPGAPGSSAPGSVGAADSVVAAEMAAQLRRIVDRSQPVSLARQQTLPLIGVMEPLFPTRGLPRGSVVEVGGAAGATSLALALVAGASRTGSWVACVGFPQLGWEAAEELGVTLERLVAVRSPPRQWATVVAALLDAFDVVVCGPEVVPTAAQVRRLQARARERGSVLVAVLGTVTALAGPGAPRRGWPTADARLRVEQAHWEGMGEGWGGLGRRRLTVVAGGRGEMSRLRRHEVVLGGDGRPERRVGADRAGADRASGPVAGGRVARRPSAGGPTPVPLEQAG